MKRLLLAFFLPAAFHANASHDSPPLSESTFQLGVGAGLSSGPYRNYSNKITPLPIIHYDGGLVYFRAAEAGVRLYKSNKNEISISANLLPVHFKAGDADSASMKRLNDRKMSGMAGLAWNHSDSWGFTTLSAQQRFTGNASGYNLGFNYGHPFLLGKTSLILSTGLNYTSAEMNKYYFGISPDESFRSGLPVYNPGSGIVPYLDFLAIYPLTKHFEASAGARLTRLSDAVHSSPMTDDRLTHSFIASVSYRF